MSDVYKTVLSKTAEYKINISSIKNLKIFYLWTNRQADSKMYMKCKEPRISKEILVEKNEVGGYIFWFQDLLQTYKKMMWLSIKTDT